MIETRERAGRPVRDRGSLTFGMGGRALSADNVQASVPLLSAPGAGTPNSTGTTNAVVTSSHGTGTLYRGVVTNAGSCTDAQLIAGTGGNLVAGSTGNQAITSSGIQTIASITGLTTGTLYQIKFISVVAGLSSAQASVNLTTT